MLTWLVRLPKFFLWRSHIRILDAVLLQHLLHRPPTSCNGHFRSIHLGPPTRQIPTIVSTGTKEFILQDAFILLVGCQWILPLLGPLHCIRMYLVGRLALEQWPDCRPLGLGYGPLHCRASDRARKSWIGNEHMDQVSCHCDTWKYDHLDDLYCCLRNRRTKAWFLDRIRRNCPRSIHQCSLLDPRTCVTRLVPFEGLRLEIVSSRPIQQTRKLTIGSFKRMYRPQTYHHIQEIQKYNIQDYRPRFAPPLPIKVPLLNASRGWNNSRKPSEKCAKCNECENNAVMPSRKPTNRKLVSCKPTTRPEREDGMERWQVRGRPDDECILINDA